MMEAADVEIDALPIDPLIQSEPSSPSPASPMSKLPTQNVLRAQMSKFSGVLGHRAFIVFWSSVSCMGIVFGDLGTSPIYSFREAFARRSFAITEDNVFGVVSLIITSLVLVVTVKYLFILCFVEGKGGAGGTLALIGALNNHFPSSSATNRFLLVPAAMIAISLFLADSLITPGVSVLSAVEGLESLQPDIRPYSPLIAILVLALLFYSQRYGSGKLGGVFGPVMLVYFLTIGTLGLATIALLGRWSIFRALNPAHSVMFMWNNPAGAWVALQSVILAITGAEALYSDMGHFGRMPIQIAWQSVVLPCLVLNYLGQGAVMLDPSLSMEMKLSPFFALAPTWYSRACLVILSTFATLIGSQSVISGAFSVIQQAMHLDMIPRLKVVVTSVHSSAQVYIPAVNAFVGCGVIALVAIFRRSSDLAAAYGLAVCGAMLVDTLLLFPVLHHLWRWKLPLALIPSIFFLIIDTIFLSSALAKIVTGGWIPLCLALGCLFVLNTWMQGRAAVRKSRQDEDRTLPVTTLSSVRRVKGTGVFFTRRQDDNIPWCLDQLYQKMGVVYERNVLVSLDTAGVQVGVCVCKDLGNEFFHATVYLSEDGANMAKLLREGMEPKLDFSQCSFFLFRENPMPVHMSKLSCQAFSIMLEVGRGTMFELIGPEIVSRCVELVRRVNV